MFSAQFIDGGEPNDSDAIKFVFFLGGGKAVWGSVGVMGCLW